MIYQTDWEIFRSQDIPEYVSSEIVERIEAFIEIEQDHFKLTKGESPQVVRRKITPGIWGEGIVAWYLDPMIWDIWRDYRRDRENQRRLELEANPKHRPARLTDIPFANAGVKARVFTKEPILSRELYYDSTEKYNISTGVRYTQVGEVPDVTLFGYVKTAQIPTEQIISWNMFNSQALEPIFEYKMTIRKMIAKANAV